MWLCVIIAFSTVGFVWFRSTSKQFVALMHPEEAQERALAEKEKTLQQGLRLSTAERPQGKQPSPFATIFDSWRNLQANISELFVGSESNLEINNNETGSVKIELPPQKLPISQ